MLMGPSGVVALQVRCAVLDSIHARHVLILDCDGDGDVYLT